MTMSGAQANEEGRERQMPPAGVCYWGWWRAGFDAVLYAWYFQETGTVLYLRRTRSSSSGLDAGEGLGLPMLSSPHGRCLRVIALVTGWSFAPATSAVPSSRSSVAGFVGRPSVWGWGQRSSCGRGMSEGDGAIATGSADGMISPTTRRKLPEGCHGAARAAGEVEPFRGSPQSHMSISWGVTIGAGGRHTASQSRQPARLQTADVMSLESIRDTLIRQEDSIIFALIERAQFRHNRAIYVKGLLQMDKTVEDYEFLKSLSFLEYVLLETEKVHSKVRRYTSPEEHPFFPRHLPDSILPPLNYPKLLADNDVDVNPQILSRYIEEIVPAICKPGDDEQHGSSTLCDITVLQAISKRVHLGKFVAEIKFQEDEEKYRRLIEKDDVEGVMELLTNRDVEARVLQRAELKASTYGQDITGMTTEFKVEPMVISAIYRDIIIPLTKDVEVLYLYQRAARQPPKLPYSLYTLNID